MPRARALAVSLAALAALDIATSLWGLTHGLREAAPAMSAAVAALGAWSVAPLKIVLALVIYALIRRVRTRSSVLAWATALAIFALPVINNFLLIQGA